MITFRNIAMDAVAPVMIEDIRVSPIQLKPVLRERPIMAGAGFVRMQEGVRTVEIAFAINEMDFEKRQRYLEAVSRWAVSEQSAPMLIPYHDGKLLDVICTGLPQPSMRQWWPLLTLTFTATDPYFYAQYEKSASCETAFFVSGDAPPRMRIERTLSAAASNQSYSDGTNTMAFSTIPAGSLVIDLNAQTAQVGSTSIMQYFGLTSAFIVPKTGTMTISGTGTVKWRERWRE